MDQHLRTIARQRIVSGALGSGVNYWGTHQTAGILVQGPLVKEEGVPVGKANYEKTHLR